MPAQLLRPHSWRVALPLLLAGLLSACASDGMQPNTAQSVNLPGDANATPPKVRLPGLVQPPQSSAEDFKGPQVVFVPGSADIPNDAGPVLDDIAARLKADPMVNAVLIGHTEDVGNPELAVAISGKCTQLVSQALIKRGARPTQIRTLARGDDKSADRCNAACQKRMRRVDIVLSSY